jgi:hypothetical protein
MEAIGRESLDVAEEPAGRWRPGPGRDRDVARTQPGKKRPLVVGPERGLDIDRLGREQRLDDGRGRGVVESRLFAALTKQQPTEPFAAVCVFG